MKSPSNLLKEKIAKVAAVVVILMSATVAIYALFFTGDRATMGYRF